MYEEWYRGTLDHHKDDCSEEWQVFKIEELSHTPSSCVRATELAQSNVAEWVQTKVRTRLRPSSYLEAILKGCY